MNCSDVLEVAPLYLTGELDSAHAKKFEAHLATCPACARELGQQQAVDRLLRASLLAEPVDSQRVERSVRQLVAHADAPRVLRNRVVAIFALAALAAVLLLAALGTRTAFWPRKQTQAVYAAAARDHQLEIVDKQPRKWLTDDASIQALARTEGVSFAAITAIAPSGYHLAQGKICRLDGHLFLHLVYVNALGNFSLFLRRTDGKATDRKSIYTETQGAEQVAGFQNHQLNALIVTGQSGDAALMFARGAAAVI